MGKDRKSSPQRAGVTPAVGRGAKAAQGQTCGGNVGGKESESVLGARLCAAVIGPTKCDSRPPRTETRVQGHARRVKATL